MSREADAQPLPNRAGRAARAPQPNLLSPGPLQKWGQAKHLPILTLPGQCYGCSLMVFAQIFRCYCNQSQEVSGEVTARKMLGHGDPSSHVVAALSCGTRDARSGLCSAITPQQPQLQVLGSAFLPCAQPHATGRERGSGMQLCSETELMHPIFEANLVGCSPSGKHTL